MKIVDAHHHLWEYNRIDYGWMDDSMSVLRRDYLPGELEKLLEDAGVGGTVVVQARQSLEETRWLLELAGKHEFIKGVVGWLDLCSPELDGQLQEFATHRKLMGVRHVIHDEPDDDFMLEEAFMKGVGQLAEYDLAYDLLLFPVHLSRALKLVTAFPRQRFVVDHISKPLIKDGLRQPWADDISALSDKPNVWCKVSGMLTEADHQGWKYEDFEPYLDVVLEAFGPDRLMLGSDWPVCLLAGGYKEVMEIPLRYFENLDPEDREKISYKNAMNFYKL